MARHLLLQLPPVLMRKIQRLAMYIVISKPKRISVN